VSEAALCEHTDSWFFLVDHFLSWFGKILLLSD